MKQVILGTAGHIDHGKTALVKALTGIDTDRLKEEKRRGITIELGFAHLTLPSGIILGIVDVPGHEKFVKHMVSGATGIDLVMLVIAADEGVMPQTREHMEICSLLNIRQGLVALTKIDLVDKDWLSLVRDDVSAFLSETFLKGARIVEVSSYTGEGIPPLLEALDELAVNAPSREPGNFFRLPVDRVFTMKGFGTVVTGTAISGQIKVGDDVTVYPKGIRSKIRGIQVHNKDVHTSGAGLRTAINLQGVEKEIIARGDVIADHDSLMPTYMVDTSLEYLSSINKKLQNRAKIRFHYGTSEVIATVILLDRDSLSKGEQCFAQFRLQKPLAFVAKDRFVIRSYSPIRTIGGGSILNPLPSKKKQFSEEALQELSVLSQGSDKDIVEQHIKSSKFMGLDINQLCILSNLRRAAVERIIEGLLRDKTIFIFDSEKRSFIHIDYYDKAKEKIQAALGDYHRRFPLKQGMMKEELKSRLSVVIRERLFNQILDVLVKEGLIAREKDIIRMENHKVELFQDQQLVLDRIEEIYKKNGLEPPYFKDLDKDIIQKGGRDLLEIMVKDHTLVKVKEDLYFHHTAIAGLEERLVKFLEEKGEITTPELKAITGVSRKYMIPLIEYFDKIQITVRVGDKRVLRKRKGKI
jgi:selenocysteine-specific elongation factor